MSPFVVRYTATTVRGCLLELLGWLRPNPQAAAAEAAVLDEDADSVPASSDAEQNLRQAIADYLAGRRVGRFVSERPLRLVSIVDPGLQAELDMKPAVRALLDSTDGRAALMADGSVGWPRLDGAAIRLASVFGRDLTRHCSLAIHDRVPPDAPPGIHYRSRFDDDEDCWAIYGHEPLTLAEDIALSPAERLVEGSYELPAFRTLNDMTTTIRVRANAEIFAIVLARLGNPGVAP